MVIATSVLWVPYLLLRRSPRRWWLWTRLAAGTLSDGDAAGAAGADRTAVR
jgi:hypothetical protein